MNLERMARKKSLDERLRDAACDHRTKRRRNKNRVKVMVRVMARVTGLGYGLGLQVWDVG